MRSFKSLFKEEKPGLYANIHAKRARIKAGSGEKMRRPGSEGAPTSQDWKDAAKTAKEEVEIEEAVSVKKQNYSWGKMVTVHHGSDTSYPLHPEHQAKIKALGDDEKTSFKDETGRHVTAHRAGDTIHLSGAGTSKKTAVKRSHFVEEGAKMPKETGFEKTFRKQTGKSFSQHVKDLNKKMDDVQANLEKQRKEYIKQGIIKEEEELEEALRHKIAGAIGQFIGNKIDPVHGEIMRVHGEEAYRQAAYHIRKTLSGLHNTLKKHLSTGKLQTEEVDLNEASSAERKERKEAINNVHKGFYDKVSKSKLKKVSKIGSDTYFVKSRSIHDPHESHFKTASGKYGSSMHSSEGGVPSHQEIHKDIKDHNPHLSKDEIKSAADVVHTHMSKHRLGEEVELGEGKYGAFRLGPGVGRFSSRQRAPYQGLEDPRTGLPLGFSHPPKKDEPKKDEPEKKTQKEEKDKDDLPFTPDKPKSPSAKPGKYGIGYSTAKHLARMALAKQKEKQKNSK